MKTINLKLRKKARLSSQKRWPIIQQAVRNKGADPPPGGRLPLLSSPLPFPYCHTFPSHSPSVSRPVINQPLSYRDMDPHVIKQHVK